MDYIAKLYLNYGTKCRTIEYDKMPYGEVGWVAAALPVSLAVRHLFMLETIRDVFTPFVPMGLFQVQDAT